MAYTTITDTTNTFLDQLQPVELITSSNLPTDMGSGILIPPNSLLTIDMQISAFQQNSGKAKIFNIRKHFLNISGVITSGSLQDLAGPDDLGTGLSASVDIIIALGNLAQLKVIGPAAGGNVIWRRDVQVIRSSASSLPAYLNFQVWGRASTGAFSLPWSGVASAGNSSNNFIEDTISTGVSAGTPVNGYYPAAFSGTKKLYIRTGVSNVGVNNIFGASAGTIIVLAKTPLVPAANVTNTHNLPGIFSANSAGMFQMGYSSAGLRVSICEQAGSVYKEAPAIPATNGAYSLFAARYTGSSVQSSVNGSDFTLNSTACGPWQIQTTVGFVGCNYAGSSFGGEILEVMLGNFAISQADLNWLKTNYFNKYNLPL